MNDRRISWVLAAAGLLLTSSVVVSVRAQECMIDAECAANEHCDMPPTVQCAGSGCPAPTTPIGQCENGKRCKSDGDCPMGAGCVKSESVPACDPADSACKSTPAVAETGLCHPKPVTCKTTADCPEGLSCETSKQDASCVSSSSGDTTCMPSTKTERVCSYVPVGCTSDKDCAANYLCTDGGSGTTSCSSSGAACAPGQQNCPPPAEPVCTTSTQKVCFPKRIDCTTDAKCPKHWLCALLPKDAQKHPPTGWQGATQTCFPEGLALALMGKIQIEGSGSSESSASGTSTKTNANDSGSPTSNNSGGCAMTLLPHAPNTNAMLLTSVAALLLIRRRCRRC
jgi:hypothetical protein